MMTVLLIVAGMLPYLFSGGLLWYITCYLESHPDSSPEPVFYLSAALLLLLWFLVSFAAFRKRRSIRAVAVPLHIIAAAELLLIKLFEILYWLDVIEINDRWPGNFYQPLSDFGFALAGGRVSFFSAYGIPFLLLLAVSLAGCEIQKIRMMRNENKEGEHP